MLALLLTLSILPFPPHQTDQEAPPAAGPPVVAIDGDEHRRYVLHAPPEGTEPPAEGWRLLVVLPGGDGSAEFAPFVGRIRENALGEEWLVLQLVAPVWEAEQAEKLVWPTRKNPWPGMELSCEELFEQAVEDVARQHELDPRFLFVLAWSSGGPLAYTLALEKESPVTGTFVAMSVYKPDLLPSRRNARGRRFHLLHSPEDFIPIRMAEEARDDLEKHRAEVRLERYPGGHGWQGDVYGMLRSGLGWMERDAARERPRRRRR